jgi:deazaflavin-dependent oxidoreductase (nitroreductase family)
MVRQHDISILARLPIKTEIKEREMWFNSIMKWLIRSPFHGLVSKSMLVIGYTGRKSGKRYETPVNYVRDGNDLLITSYQSRTWWRNMLDEAPVTVWLAGKQIRASAEAYSDSADVTRFLQAYLDHVPQQARYFNVTLDEQGHPAQEQVFQAAQERVIVRVRLSA